MSTIIIFSDNIVSCPKIYISFVIILFGYNIMLLLPILFLFYRGSSADDQWTVNEAWSWILISNNREMNEQVNQCEIIRLLLECMSLFQEKLSYLIDM